jgi:NitT/TauT family transport system substrate-binding protein
MPIVPTRRHLLTTLSLAGAAGLLGIPRAGAGSGTLETRTVRFLKSGLCVSTLYVAEQLLRAEGFTDIRYVARADLAAAPELSRGEADFAANYASASAREIDSGERITLLAGIMVGCFELFARDGIGSVAELKGKTVGIQALGSNPHLLVTLLAAEVGLDPERDIRWVTDPKASPIDRFIDGRIDAFLAFPPEPQELRARSIGHVLVNTARDHPWSQYFCCMLAGSSAYVQAYPNATKSVLRAVLKAADLCATDPAAAARRLAAGGRAPADYAAQTFSDNNYKWREFDPEDTIRWYALRLRETGLIKSTPQEIIAAGTDWSFLDELKREMKA